MKKIILLLIVISLLCSMGIIAQNIWLENRYALPDNYTGGIKRADNYGLEYEDYWVETYDECMNAINKMQSHGSVIKESVIFKYEGDLFDVKYCFSFNRKTSEKIVFGNDPFDRYAEVYVQAYAFFEDVKIDDLIYSYVNDYDCYTADQLSGLHRAFEHNIDLSPDGFDFEIYENAYYISKDNYNLYCVVCCCDTKVLISEQAFEIIFDTVEFIGFE